VDEAIRDHDPSHRPSSSPEPVDFCEQKVSFSLDHEVLVFSPQLGTFSIDSLNITLQVSKIAVRNEELKVQTAHLKKAGFKNHGSRECSPCQRRKRTFLGTITSTSAPDPSDNLSIVTDSVLWTLAGGAI